MTPTGLTVYSILALGTAIAPLLAPPPDRPATTGDLLAVVVGLSAIVNGSIMLLMPDQFASVIFDPVRPSGYFAVRGRVIEATTVRAVKAMNGVQSRATPSCRA